MSRRTSRNNNYSSGIRPSGIFRATVTAVNGSLVNVKIPRLGLENIYEDCPVVGPTPSVNDNIFVGFLEGQTSNPVALTSTDANTGDIDSVVAGTALSGGGTTGTVTVNFDPISLTAATAAIDDYVVIADASDSNTPKRSTVASIVSYAPQGDITAVTAGTAISGGGASGDVTVNFAPSELSSVTVATDDKVVIADTSDSDNPKHVTAQSIANLASASPGGSTSQIQYNNSGSFAGSANFTFDGTSTVTLTDTDAGSEAAPIIELYRNSASPADADYIGQIKFQAENDNDQKVVYAKISGKIDDASDTTEDGIIEIMLQKAGSNNIAMRFNSTTMKLINGTGIEVNGAGQFDSTVDIDDDLTIGTDKFFVDVSTGKTGVGTTSPVAAIDLVGQVGDTFTTSNWRKAVGINTGNLLYWRTASSVDWGIGATGGDMYFTSSTASDNSAAPDYRMIIKGDTGNVGIGTTTPSQHLVVNGNAVTTTTRATTAFYVGASGDDGIGPVTGVYGNVQTVGEGKNGYEGYSISGRAVFMHDGGSNTGIRDDVNSQWMWYGAHNGATQMFHAGSAKVTTSSTGVTVTGAVTATTGSFSSSVYSPLYNNSGTSTRDKVRVWNSSTYCIGMKSGYKFGALGGTGTGSDYAMSFQMSNSSNRGFWWGDSGHSDSQGAMSLTTTGKLYVATGISVGAGESKTDPNFGYALTNSGTSYLYGNVTMGSLPGVSGYYTVRRRNSDGLLGYASSSQRYKENIADAGSDWQKVYDLRPVTFDWRESMFDNDPNGVPADRSDFGLIAEEVASVLPKLAEYRVIEGEGDDPIPDSVDYEKLTVYLLSAVKGLKARIEVLEG